MSLRLHSGVNESGLRKPRGLKASRLILEGEYEGFRCYGPYIKKYSNRVIEYFRLIKGDVKIDVEAAKIDPARLESPPENTKPFLDFIR